MQNLTVTIITFNEERNIARCVRSVKDIASEILVVDSQSADRTAEICRELGCRVIDRPFTGYGEQKQFAVDQASNDWILSLDADEEVSPELAENIRTLLSGENQGSPAYKLLRRLVYQGKVMRYSGLGHEYIIRLFNRKHAGFTRVPVHEEILSDAPAGKLKGEFYHYSYTSIANQVEKTNRYTTIAAEEYHRKGRRFFKCWVYIKFPVTFFTVFVLKGGFLDGYPGLLWSFFAAFYGSLKIAKTIELNRTK